MLLRLLLLLVAIALLTGCLVPEGYQVVVPTFPDTNLEARYQGYFLSCFDAAYRFYGPYAAYDVCMERTRQANAEGIGELEIPRWSWPLATPRPMPTRVPTPTPTRVLMGKSI